MCDELQNHFRQTILHGFAAIIVVGRSVESLPPHHGAPPSPEYHQRATNPHRISNLFPVPALTPYNDANGAVVLECQGRQPGRDWRSFAPADDATKTSRGSVPPPFGWQKMHDCPTIIFKQIAWREVDDNTHAGDNEPYDLSSEFFNPSTTRRMPVGPAPAARGDDGIRGGPAGNADGCDRGITSSDVPDVPRSRTALVGLSVPIHPCVVAGVVLAGAVDWAAGADDRARPTAEKADEELPTEPSTSPGTAAPWTMGPGMAAAAAPHTVVMEGNGFQAPLPLYGVVVPEMGCKDRPRGTGAAPRAVSSPLNDIAALFPAETGHPSKKCKR